MITPLNFDYTQLPPSIPARKKTRRFQAENGSTFSNSGTSVIRIPIRDGAYLDGKNSYLKFTLTNNSDQKLTLDPNAQAVIQRTRVLVGGVVAEDIQYSNVLVNNLCVSQGSEDYNKALQIIAGQSVDDADQDAVIKATDIASSGESTFCIPVFSGLLNCDKYLPLGLFGSNALTLELYLENDTRVGTYGDTTNVASTFGYTLSNVEYIASLIDIQSDVVNDALRQQMMTSGLEFHGTTYTTHVNNHTSGGTLTVNIPERCQSLKGLISVVQPQASTAVTKNLQSHYPHTTAGKDFNWYYRIGSELLPQQAVSSSAESFIEFQKLYNHLFDLKQSTNANVTRWNHKYGNADTTGCFSMSISTESFSQTNAESGLNTASNSTPISLIANGVACDAALVLTYAYKDIIWSIDSTGVFQVSL